MTTMNTDDLVQLGFTPNEAEIYMILVQYGKADANFLIRKTKFHKKIVYDYLEKLIDKGLVSYITEEKRRVFQIASPEMLPQLFAKEKKELDTKIVKAQNFAKEVSSIAKKLKFKQEAAIYRGKAGIRSFYAELIERKQPYVVFGAPQESLEIMSPVFWDNIVRKLEANKISSRLLFNESIRSYGKTLNGKFCAVKYFSKDFEPLTETNIQGNRVAIIVWSEDPMLFLIEDHNVALSYKSYFENMWKEGKK